MLSAVDCGQICVALKVMTDNQKKKKKTERKRIQQM
jgi:hypothetical protein